MADQFWVGRVAAVALSACLMPVVGHAQTMYRCGATYQDRPCNGVDSKPVGSHVRQAAGQSVGAASIDPVCEARGTAAQKLMWEKESGRTLSEQLAKPGADANLARNVYGRRGSSLDVRRAIEADCVKEMDQANEAAALLKAASKVQQPGVAAAGGGNQALAPSGGVGVASAGAQPSADELASRKAAAKAAACAAVTTELNELTQAQRTGGDAAHMDVLAARVRDAQSRKRAAAC
ncbi:MAG: hypothetical protein HY019_12295 [Aquabacterium sp.]|uniref:hypothetical protein n=1 Tax=Aquabacterium sp. TaxID=1872578 RepID=UPI0025C047F0|nr:hypothetical protein [Aquabacterium sp.]MBI3382777.1 hypothetical protein [Aquabacterium sp.]